MTPGDYVIFPTADHVTFIWRITGIYYGAMGQEDVIGLQSVSRTNPVAHGKDIEEMLVPLELVQDHIFERRLGRQLQGAGR